VCMIKIIIVVAVVDVHVVAVSVVAAAARVRGGHKHLIGQLRIATGSQFLLHASCFK